MADPTKRPNLNPYTSSNPISKALFTWCLKYLGEVNAHGATPQNLFPPMPEQQCKYLTEISLQVVHTGKSYRQSRVTLRILMDLFAKRSDYVQWFIVAFVSTVLLRVLTCLTLSYSLAELALNDTSHVHGSIGILITSIFFIVILCMITLMHNMRQFWGICYGERLRVGLKGVIYHKLVKLPLRLLTLEKINHVIEIFFTDLYIITKLPNKVQEICLAVVLLQMSFILLYLYVGTAGLIGLGICVVTGIPLHILAAYSLVKIDQRMKKKRATTVSIISDILAGIETIKVACISDVFIQIVRRAHDRELRSASYRSIPEIILWLANKSFHRIGWIITILIFILQGNILTIGQVMMVVIVFEYFCSDFLRTLSETVIVFMKSSHALDTVNDFLRLTEQRRNPKTNHNSWEIQFLNVSTLTSHNNAALKNITLTVPAGQLTVICGALNSGYRSIVPVLIDDVHLQSGRIKVGGVISYYFKTGVLVEGSIKRNITLGSKFDRHHYLFIKKLCGLNSEIRRIEGEDETVLSVAEYWPALEQKVLLARTLYPIANIYVFETPFIQMVNSVERLIFEDSILKYLKGITRLMITNQYFYLKQADKIFYFEGGRIKAEGTFDEVKRLVPDFELVIKHGIDAQHGPDLNSTAPPFLRPRSSQFLLRIPKSNPMIFDILAILKQRHKVYRQFFTRRFDHFGSVLLFALMICTGVLPFIGHHFLFKWSAEKLIANFTQYKGGYERHKQIHTLLSTQVKSFGDFFGIFECRIFFIVNVILIPLHFFQYAIVARTTIKRVRVIYKMLLDNVFKKNFVFYYTISSQSLYELFANDIYIVLNYLPVTFIAAADACSTIIAAMVLFIYLDYYLAVVLTLYSIVAVYMVIWFKRTCRRLQNLEHSLRFPIIQQIKQTQNLLTVLRSSGLIENQIKQFYGLINKHTAAVFMVVALKNAFRTWVILLNIGLTIIILAIYAFHYVRDPQYSYGINIEMYYMTVIILFVNVGFQDLLNLWYLENNIKRIAEHDNSNLEDTESGLRYPKIWAQPPTLRFSRISGPNFGHASVDIRLLKIESGEHVGLIGRPGSGRSVLMKMLIRLYPYEGIIKCNSKKITEINVCTLRRNIFYLSADTSLFAPTLRFNLDPRNEYTDSILWMALKTIGFTSDTISLENVIEPRGRNITQEQKILILLTRAFLLKCKVLIVDNIFETFSNVTQTDVEDIIFREFNDCTLIIIESRLNYIMRCHRIVVLDRGSIMDDDIPGNVYSNRTDFLHTIVDKTGYVNSSKLSRFGYTSLDELNQMGPKDSFDASISEEDVNDEEVETEEIEAEEDATEIRSVSSA